MLSTFLETAVVWRVPYGGISKIIYSKTCVKRPLKKKVFMTNGSLMKVDSVAECSSWKRSILQYFRPALSKHWD